MYPTAQNKLLPGTYSGFAIGVKTEAATFLCGHGHCETAISPAQLVLRATTSTRPTAVRRAAKTGQKGECDFT